MTEQQKGCLEEFRERVLASEYADDFQKDPGGNRLLLRFLRATMKDKTGSRTFRVDEAYERIVKTFVWRRQHNIHALQQACEEERPPPKFDLFRSLYPCISAVNPETGHYIRWAYFGKFISSLDTAALTEEEWLQCFAYDCLSIERTLRQESAARGVEVTTYVSVPDMSGLSLMGVARRLDFIKHMSQVSCPCLHHLSPLQNAADHFPELLGRTLMIQCPWIFSKVYALAAPLIDKDTQSKFVLCNGIPADEFEQVIPQQFWPRDYGGEGPPLPLPLHAQ